MPLDLRLTPQAKNTISELKKRYWRFESQWKGFTWLMRRDPRAHKHEYPYENDRHYSALFKGDIENDLPDMYVMYTFDDNTLTIIGVFDVHEPVVISGHDVDRGRDTLF